MRKATGTCVTPGAKGPAMETREPAMPAFGDPPCISAPPEDSDGSSITSGAAGDTGADDRFTISSR